MDRCVFVDKIESSIGQILNSGSLDKLNVMLRIAPLGCLQQKKNPIVRNFSPEVHWSPVIWWWYGTTGFMFFAKFPQYPYTSVTPAVSFNRHSSEKTNCDQSSIVMCFLVEHPTLLCFLVLALGRIFLEVDFPVKFFRFEQHFRATILARISTQTCFPMSKYCKMRMCERMKTFQFEN